MPSFKHDYDRLLNRARVELAGATDAGIKNVLFDVLHEFFLESGAWTEDLTVPVIPDTLRYDLTPTLGEIVRLNHVINGNLQEVPATLSEDLSQVVLRYSVNDPQEYVINVVMTVGMPISREAKPEIPEWMLARWGPVVLEGLLGNMMLHKTSAYSNPGMARYHLARWRNGLGMARTATLRRNVHGVNNWIYPQSYRTRGQRGGLTTR